MALWDRIRGRGSDVEVLPRVRPITMEELLEAFDPVEITPSGAIAVVPRQLAAQTEEQALRIDELGKTGTSYSNLIREDYNPSLRGQNGYRKYDQMRRSDAQVRGVMRLVKTPITAARWYVEPATDSRTDVRVAEFISNNLFKWMTMSWPQLLNEILMMLDYGWYSFEKVYTIKDNKIIWKKFAPRHPLDLSKWVWDANGGPQGAMYWREDAWGHMDEIFIPVEKLAIFTHDKEAGNLEGLSVLRSAYKHWFYKENLYKIDAIQKERHGIGVPIIKLPPNFSGDDRRVADELGSNLRTNEKAHVVLPPMWDIMMLKMEGQPVNAMESIEHHDVMIARNVLGHFINLSGSISQESQQDIFMKACRYVADVVRDVFNKYCIPSLVDYNWKTVDEYPELRVRRIGDVIDWRTISFAMRNFIGAGVLVPDDRLELWVRDEMDLPKPDPETARELFTPQGPPGELDPMDEVENEGDTSAGRGGRDARPGRGGFGADASHQNESLGFRPAPPNAGMPRQSRANRQRIGTGSSRVGRDGRGR